MRGAGETEPGAARDRHLFGPGPKRILALDGGGTKGIIELAFLARIETLLRALHGDDPQFRLSDWFDLIGGTSTGAIIAAGLAMGKSVAEITRLYIDLAPKAFARHRWRVAGLMSRFDARPLVAFLQAEFGGRTLETDDLKTGFAAIAHRFDTGSPWLIANNPRAPYWADPTDRGYIGNRHYSLPDIVRASTAAPGYFEPQRLHVTAGGAPAMFVDGGLSPHNNPSLLLLLMTQAKAYGLNWPNGRGALGLISIGAGQYRRGMAIGTRPPSTAGILAVQGLMQSLATAQMQTLTLLQWMSEPAMPWPINSEIGDLSGELLGGREMFGFQRYDMPLEESWLAANLGMTFAPRKLAALRRLDGPDFMAELYEMASKAAVFQVDGKHLTGLCA